MSYFVHDTSVVDEGAEIGNDTSIWFFSHITPIYQGSNL